ncbi:MAG: glucose-6-phosphate isomerase [Phycisphaerales bacterium]|nr:glucose-6-phosphate isomerase [Phycisphaerales bacterium]
MAAPQLRLDYASTLDTAVGSAHGLSLAEIERAAEPVREAVQRIEAERRAGQHRYRDLPDDAEMRRVVTAAVKRYAARKFENLVVLGIGGSALGNIALQTALNPCYHNVLPARSRRGPRLFVMDNVDPTQFGNLLDVIGPAVKKTLFNVISKSGETAETAAQFLIVRDLLARKLGKGLARNLVVTTDPEGGTMRGIVDAAGYDALPVPPGVGGRFSVLSAVGLFSAGMCGVRIDKLLAGAAAMSRRVAQSNVSKNPAAMLALLLHAFYVRGKRLYVMMPYSYQLKDLADWYRQLWAESLGKADDLDGNRVNLGPTPIKALGATDQHSQVQLYREGPNDKVFIFLEVERFARDVPIPKVAGLPADLAYLQGKTLGKLLNAEKAATEYALVQSQRPCMTIRFPVVSEETVGQFILLWEAATTIAGRLMNINPYDQPAVQLGKEFTFALMGKKGYRQQADAYKAYAKSRGKAAI